MCFPRGNQAPFVCARFSGDRVEAMISNADSNRLEEHLKAEESPGGTREKEEKREKGVVHMPRRLLAALVERKNIFIRPFFDGFADPSAHHARPFTKALTNIFMVNMRSI